MGNNVGRLIKAWRRLNKLSQEQLAQQLKVSLITVSRWERGITKPSPMATKILTKKGVIA